MADKMLYNTVVAQTFSPCGNYLLAGNTYGEIVVYDLQQILSPRCERTASLRTPVFRFTPQPDMGVCSMVSTEDFLLVGTVGEISAFEWDTIITMKCPSVAWKISIPSRKDEVDKADVNSMSLRTDMDKLYAGCGDNQIYCFDLEGAKLCQTFEGHDDFIHCIDTTTNKMVSASEDGSAKIWDLRKKTEVHTVKPYMESQLNNPSLGRWVGAASINDDWMLCGGGPSPGLWHLRSMSLAESYAGYVLNGVHVAMLYEDRVLLGGASNKLTHLSLTGSVMAQVPSSSTCLYSVVLQTKTHRVLCMAGSSAKIDLCTNFNYRDQILSFSK